MSKRVDTLIQLRSKNVEELLKLNEEYRAELFALKFQVVVGSVEKTDRIQSLKKDIARIQTLLSEKSRAGEQINKVVKANYAEAVEKAEVAGKEVRKNKELWLKKCKQNNLEQILQWVMMQSWLQWMLQLQILKKQLR
nr:50S ribosomal protein L29 [Spiroplasma clarkii]